MVADVRSAMRGVAPEPRVAFDADEMSARLLAMAEAVRIAPVDLTVVPDRQLTFNVHPGSTGREADPSALVAALTADLGRLDAPAEVRLDLAPTTVEPDVTRT